MRDFDRARPRETIDEAAERYNQARLRYPAALVTNSAGVGVSC